MYIELITELNTPHHHRSRLSPSPRSHTGTVMNATLTIPPGDTGTVPPYLPISYFKSGVTESSGSESGKNCLRKKNRQKNVLFASYADPVN